MTTAGIIFLLVVIAVVAVFSIAIAAILLPGALRRSTVPADSDISSPSPAGAILPRNETP